MFKVIEKQGIPVLRQVEDELAAVAEVLRTQPDLLRSFEVPAVTPTTKRALLEAIGSVLGLRAETRRLLAALELHYRLRFMADVVAAFRALVDRKDGMTRGAVELPAAPTAEQMAALAAALGSLLGTRVELESKVQPDLIAGFVVKVGSTVFDGSLRAQLQRFARSGGER
jgi:F-type H+-transporting ATPase subunit delta